MATLVNLRRFRKAKARQNAAALAAENRASFGMSKAERSAVEAGRTMAIKQLDGHRRTLPAAVHPAAAVDDEDA